MSYVCSECIDESNLQEFIKDADGDPGCDYCGKDDAPTVLIDDLIDYLRDRIETFFGRAVNNLMYISAEGGYVGGRTYQTWDILFDQFQIELPRDSTEELRQTLVDAFDEDAPWCDFDPARLDEDESMLMDWERFCAIVKYDRRFFFHARDEADADEPWNDTMSPRQLLKAIAQVVDRRGLVTTVPAGYEFFRARPAAEGETFATAAELGPPLPEQALQSNRMNPPGIPMLYGSESSALAMHEVRSAAASVGRFHLLRKARILDLVNLPPIPGMLSTAERDEILALSFLHRFAEIVSAPVARDDRTVLEYIPTQVFTEFLRDYTFQDGAIDGIRYRSATGEPGANLVLFATPANVGGAMEAREHDWESPRDVWIALTDALNAEASALGSIRGVPRPA